MDISIMIEGQMGVNWPRWKDVVREVEALGFAGLFRSDHFTNPHPPDEDSLDMLVSLAYTADRSSRIHFGPLVAPVSFRDPVMLARQAAAIDDLSGGRMILGLGAGWQEREHAMFGYQLGNLDTRFARLEEALEVTTRLFRGEDPVSFEGQFYQLRDAVIKPKRQGGPRVCIGGNGLKRTLPLVARYAHVWNAVGLKPDDFRARSQELDRLLREQGRQPGDVKRTMMTSQVFATDQVHFEARLRANTPPEAANLPYDELLARHREKGWYALLGTPEMIGEQLGALSQAGVQELMLQWFDLDDMESLRVFAEHILPLAARV